MGLEHAQKLSRVARAFVTQPGKALDVSLARVTGTVYAFDYQTAHEVPLCLYLPDMVSGHIYMKDSYEPEVTAFMDEALQSGQTFWDVGSHIGYHSAQARRIVGETGSVIAFEPTKRTFDWLQINAEMHGIETHQIALGEKDGSTQIKDFGIMFSGWNSVATPREDHFLRSKHVNQATEYEVPVRSVDSMIDKGIVPIPDLIKIDAENAEMNILQGALYTIARHKPKLILEAGGQGRDDGNSTTACLTLLREHGYTFKVYEDDAIVDLGNRDPDQWNNILCIPTTPQD